VCIGITPAEINPSFSHREVLSAAVVLSGVTSRSVTHTNNLLGKSLKVALCDKEVHVISATEAEEPSREKEIRGQERVEEGEAEEGALNFPL